VVVKEGRECPSDTKEARMMDKKLERKLGVKHVDVIVVASVEDEGETIAMNSYLTDPEADEWVSEQMAKGHRSFARLRLGILGNNQAMVAKERAWEAFIAKQKADRRKAFVAESIDSLLTGAFAGAAFFTVLTILQSIPTN
jgi:hypothetical protein